MDFYEVVNKRKSCRDYLPKEVEEEKLMRVLDAARMAPSWKNWQCWHYFVVKGREIIEKIGAALKNNPNETAYKNATYIIVLCADPSKSGNLDGKSYYMVDCGISMEHLCLAAANEGLGTCWVGWFDEKPLYDLLNIPKELKIVALTPLGYPTGEYRQRPRQSLEEMITVI